MSKKDINNGILVLISFRACCYYLHKSFSEWWKWLVFNLCLPLCYAIIFYHLISITVELPWFQGENLEWQDLAKYTEWYLKSIHHFSGVSFTNVGLDVFWIPSAMNFIHFCSFCFYWLRKTYYQVASRFFLIKFVLAGS